MAEEIPISEVRRVVIQYEIQVPQASRAAAPSTPTAPEIDIQDLARKLRDEFIRVSRRNADLGF